MLDPLPPDMRFERLLPNPEELALSFAAKGSLYLRRGFVRTHETDMHVFLERPAHRTREQ
jgi:hypothetical protein